MKKYLPLLLLGFLFFAPKAHAAISLVQVATTTGVYVNSKSFSFPNSVTAGDLLVMSVTIDFSDQNYVSSVSDNVNGNWTLATSSYGLQRETFLYYFPNSAGASPTMQVQLTSGNYRYITAVAYEYSGIATSSPLDVTAEGADGGSQTSHSSNASAATSQPQELVVVGGGFSDDTSVVAGSGYGDLNTVVGGTAETDLLEDLITSTTGSQTGSYTTSGANQGETVLATFKQPSSATTTAAPFYPNYALNF